MIFATVQADPAPPAPAMPDTSSLILNLVGMMLVVGVLCGAIFLIARRVNPLRSSHATASGPLRHLDSVRINHRCTLHLIEAGDQQVVVGTDSGGIQLMVVLNEDFQDVLQEQLETPNASSP